jgi:hypothetical protein
MKPVGSEKIENADQKLARIIEIAGINGGSINENKQMFGKQSNILHEAVAADGTEYGIVQEVKRVYIKVKNNNKYDYISGIENIHEHSYKSYADALKHLNLMFKQINENVGQSDNIDILKKKL